MMRPQILIFSFGLFAIGTILSCLASGIWLGTSEVSIINQISGINVANVQTMGGWGVPKGGADWINGILTIISWNYPYLSNPWGFVFKLVFLYPITVVVIWAVWELFLTVVQGLATALRSLIP